MLSDTTSLHLRTCVTPDGRFATGVHRPSFRVANLRGGDRLLRLGQTASGRPCTNEANFPAGDVEEQQADAIHEIPNAFPFRGATYICEAWARRAADDPAVIRIPQPPAVSLHTTFRAATQDRIDPKAFLAQLPAPLRIALATTSTDPEDLIALASLSCRLIMDPATAQPGGLSYIEASDGSARPEIYDHILFETVANNPHLPDPYKTAMVLTPGVQGGSEIVGEWQRNGSHVYEYLRRNSYIAWGHYAANMAEDAVRYSTGALCADDVHGMRHLYYQRTFVRLAQSLEAGSIPRRRNLTAQELETLRIAVARRLASDEKGLPFTATLWGWNYGFDYAPSGYRLHASHQQIHQQFALIPENIPFTAGGRESTGPAYAFGDLVHDFGRRYRQQTGRSFFDCYLQAIRANQRLDGRADRPRSLIVYEDAHVLLFVPKAQTSQWELQLMPIAPVGHIVEADVDTRRSLDKALLIAMRVLSEMGAAMITVFEAGKRFQVREPDQRLLYVFLPRVPESPGAFSEAQLRWINGHFPEDFAEACRMRLASAALGME